MGLLARLIPGPALDERMAIRTPVSIDANLNCQAGGCEATVLDISTDGFLASTDIAFELGAHVTLELASLASLGAVVQWRDEDRHGFRFDTPLSLAQVHEISQGITWREL